MRVNVVFGSASDKNVYEPLCDRLRAIEGLDVYFEVCSAHRDPERLRTLIKEKPCEAWVAGAGIAAHLPGVVASQTLTPVIGVPCTGVLQGMDALLSILQMPKGIPVLTAGVENVSSIVELLGWFSKNQAGPPVLHVVASPGCDEQVKKLREPLEGLGWTIKEQPTGAAGQEGLEIWLVDIEKASEHPAIRSRRAAGAPGSKDGSSGGPAIAVPIYSQKQYSGELRVLGDITACGALWVGVNNITNVQLSLLQLWPVGPKERALLDELKGGGKKGAIA